jgi:alpha-tubulin suppressor-like RCC1 family protein
MRPLRVLALTMACLGAACAQTPSGTSTGASRLSLVAPPSQVARSGIPLEAQPVVEVLDLAGNRVMAQGILVTASIATGGGTIQGSTELRTNAEGRVAFTDLVLSGLAGPRTLRFSAPGLSAVLSGVIALEAGRPASAAVVAGNNQTAPAGTDVPVAPAVRVTDLAGNPVAGVEVVFTVTSGDGMLVGGLTQTGPDGVAAVQRWRLGPVVGLNTLSVAVTGLAGSPLVLSATGVVGPAASLTLVEGDGQVAVIGHAVPVPPAVRVADAFDNPIPGLTIAFSVEAGGGFLTGAVATSGANGVARVQAWRMGLTPGENRVAAVREGTEPVSFTAAATDFATLSLAAGGLHTCAVDTGGAAWCWGENSSGQLGRGTLFPDSVPAPVVGGLGLSSVVAGGAHSCGLTPAGAAWCWGANGEGQLGAGPGPNRTAPVLVDGGHVFVSLALGGIHTCGLRADGALYCWGANFEGQLGTGTFEGVDVPTLVTGGHTFSTVSAGDGHTCAVRTDGALLCWGGNEGGRLGDGTVVTRAVPGVVANPGPWTGVAAGGDHTCGLLASGAAMCWGRGAEGQLGHGAFGQVLAPVAVAGGHTFTALAAGAGQSCGLRAAGTALCWGFNEDGGLGTGTFGNVNVPVTIAAQVALATLQVRGGRLCARNLQGSAICWGRNDRGQVGDGTTAVRVLPVGVRRP